jgi:hypothetical protein
MGVNALRVVDSQQSVLVHQVMPAVNAHERRLTDAEAAIVRNRVQWERALDQFARMTFRQRLRWIVIGR